MPEASHERRSVVKRGKNNAGRPYILVDRMNTRRYAGPIIGAGQLRVNWVYFSLKPAASSLLKAAPTLNSSPTLACLLVFRSLVPCTNGRNNVPACLYTKTTLCLAPPRCRGATNAIIRPSIYSLYVNLFMGVNRACVYMRKKGECRLYSELTRACTVSLSDSFFRFWSIFVAGTGNAR